ncbi:MAG: hypothetical protein QF718_02530 [Phycisphaerales bacterium]|jgi:hypothetical protein|nr:hypothetical protein [Phycisphaerales bacterium]
MKNTSRAGLIALNTLLLAVFAAVSFVPVSDAQTTQLDRYVAITSDINGLTQGAVYIMDTNTQQLLACAWDHNKNRIIILGYRSISSDRASVPGNK